MVKVLNSQDLIYQLNITKVHVLNLLKGLLAEMTLQITLYKEVEYDEIKYAPSICFNSTQTVSNNSVINGSLETSYQIILSILGLVKVLIG